MTPAPTTPAKPALGDIVAIGFVDSGQIVEEVGPQEDFCIVRGTVWGRVHVCNDEQIAVIFQQFQTGNVRGALIIPWCAVEQVAILARANEP